MNFRKYAFLGVIALCAFNLNSQDLPPEISVVGSQLYCASAPIPIVTSATITDPDPEDTLLDEVFVQIAEGYVFGQDQLTLGGVNPNITSTWNQNEGQLTLIGPATFTEFETAIENIFFETTQTVFTDNRQFTVNLGNANYLPSTGHYYFYVSSPGITWTQARDAAAAQDYFGLTGYLATLTSSEEAQLAGEQSSGTGWIGASDEEAEGTWKWVTGPEAGTTFWQGSANGNAVNGEFSFWNSGEPNNAGNENYAHITAPNIGILGSWNDLAVTGDPNTNSDYHPQGYIVEFGGFPNEPEINLSANSTIIMPRILSEDVAVCGTEQVAISIESSTSQVDWYTSETAPNPIHSGTSYNVTLTETTTFWLLPVVPDCTNNVQRFPVTVTVNPIPNVNDITIVQCEDEVMDGLATFNLSFYNDVLVNGSLDDIQVSYFSNVALTEQIDENDYTNVQNNQTIYALVVNTVSQCSTTAEVLLTVNTNASEPVDLTACDSLDETGTTSFDLTQAENLILANAGFDKQIQGFYESFNDALFLQNNLGSTYTNNQPYYQTIFARVEQNGSCYSIVEVNLIVEELPNLMEDETVYYCVDGFPETISLYGGIVDDVPNNYYYNWSTGETTIHIDINEPGTYTVEVTKPFGCTNERTITVLPSSIATIESIEISDLSENNTITVLTSGDGEYVYALDDENGAYQESNVFENVSPGIYTVFVKDIKADCGNVAEDVAVMGFPKFFTPNGDTVNDTWKVFGFSSQLPVTTTVKIFNRFGKFVAMIDEDNPTWDGTYNGEPLPTDDYWFLANLVDGRVFKGHFTLKR